MKKTGAQLAVYALEQIGVKFTFGIPGTHTTELYDAMNKSELITPVLVTHEGGVLLWQMLYRAPQIVLVCLQ